MNKRSSKPESRAEHLPQLVSLLLTWFAQNARDLPWRRTQDPYGIWVSEIMLQQTQVKTVIPFWERWMRELPTVTAAAKAPSAKIHKLWEGLGYYTRVRNLQKAAQVIMEKHGGQFPTSFDEVLALPGIGRYTAGAICSIAFNQPTPILDGNVVRVLTRIFGIAENPKGKTTNARLWQLAEELVTCANSVRWGERPNESRSASPKHASATRADIASTREQNCSHLNQSLMELGATICSPRNPQCLICPANKLCSAFKENRVEELPNLGKRETATARHFIAFAVEQNGKYLVRQRPGGVVNAHLWEFPNVESPNGTSDKTKLFEEIFGAKPATLKSLCTIKHSITRYRITLEAFITATNRKSPKTSGGWKTPAQLNQLAFTSAHKKILAKLVAAKNR